MVDLDTLALLMMPREKRPKKVKPANYDKGFAMVRTDEGLIKLPLTPEVKASIGRFEGKQGSTRRSSKGRTWIMPNGYVKYIASTDMEVVGYVSK